MPNNKPRWFFPLKGGKSGGTVDSSEWIPGSRGGDKKKQGWSNSTQQVQALFTAPSPQRGISETWSASQLAPISSVRQHWNLEALVSTGRSQQRSHKPDFRSRTRPGASLLLSAPACLKQSMGYHLPRFMNFWCLLSRAPDCFTYIAAGTAQTREERIFKREK